MTKNYYLFFQNNFILNVWQYPKFLPAPVFDLTPNLILTFLMIHLFFHFFFGFNPLVRNVVKWSDRL